MSGLGKAEDGEVLNSSKPISGVGLLLACVFGEVCQRWEYLRCSRLYEAKSGFALHKIDEFCVIYLRNQYDSRWTND